MRVLFDHQIFSYQTFGGASRYYCEVMNVFARTGEPAFDLAVAESPDEYLARSSYYQGKKLARGGTASFLRTYARNELKLEIVRADAHARCAARHILRSGHSPQRPRPQARGDGARHDPGAVPGGVRSERALRAARDEALDRRQAPAVRARRFDHRDLGDDEAGRRVVLRDFPDRITVTHLGNNLASTAGQPAPDGFPAKYVLFVGTRNTYKNFPLFIEGVAPLVRADAELGVVCIGGGAFNDSERALLERESIGSRVIQRSVGDHELASCYANAAAFVFPSLYEGFGIPIVEAFACGCPALLANASCFPEIAGDAARYFDPQDRESLSSELRTILGDPAVRETMRAKGRARAKELTWEATAEKTLDVYRHVTGSAASRWQHHEVPDHRLLWLCRRVSRRASSARPRQARRSWRSIARRGPRSSRRSMPRTSSICSILPAVEKLIANEQPDYIVHLASYSSVGYSWHHPVASFSNNTNIFLNVLECVRRFSPRTRVLSVGSSEEYGLVAASDLPLRESARLSPLSPYAVARVAQEQLGEVYVRGYKLDIVATRSFNHVGAGQSDQFVISAIGKQFAELAKGKRDHIVVGTTTVVRDFLDVRDVVSAYRTLLARGTSGEVYNICSGVGTSIDEVIRLFGSIAGAQPNRVTDPALLRPIENEIVIGSHEKLTTAVGWGPQHTLEQSLRSVYEFWLARV